MSDLLHTLLDLADATSRNLDFAHKSKYQVSYGEETITETNLLELLRRHSDVVQIETFSKAKEAKNGADWEWTLLGKKYQYAMRVQAKRIQKNGTLRIKHAVGKQKLQQIDLLLSDAKAFNLDAFYCIYCSEKDRIHWGSPKIQKNSNRLSEFGCLMVGADKVKSIMPKKLVDIEKDCFPWHFLAFDDDLRLLYADKTYAGSTQGMSYKFASQNGLGTGILVETPEKKSRPADMPTIDFLNGFSEQETVRTGLVSANPEEAFRDRTSQESVEYRERGIRKRVVLDVRSFDRRSNPDKK